MRPPWRFSVGCPEHPAGSPILIAMRRRRARRPVEVADGVFQLGTRWVNYYLVTEGDGAILVDAGYPGYAADLEAAFAALGRRLTDVEAVIVTHHHVDHAGTAEHLRASGATVHVAQADAAIVRGERPSHPPGGFYGQAWRLSMIRYLAHTVRVGGARYQPTERTEQLIGGQLLNLPGGPRALATPGHTAGHCSVLLAERGVLLAGNALVNFDYASGRRGVNLHRFNEDRAMAWRSLEQF